MYASFRKGVKVFPVVNKCQSNKSIVPRKTTSWMAHWPSWESKQMKTGHTDDSCMLLITAVNQPSGEYKNIDMSFTVLSTVNDNLYSYSRYNVECP